jgi:hypothetical protein
MKLTLGLTQSTIDIAFDYSNLVLGTYIPFIWNLNTNKYNLEGRLWNYQLTSNFYLKLVSQYTHIEYFWAGEVLLTNNRYTEARFTGLLGQDDPNWNTITENFEDVDINWEQSDNIGLATKETDGFFYGYYITDNGTDAVCIHETLFNIEITGKKTTFTPMITDNENREIIYA